MAGTNSLKRFLKKTPGTEKHKDMNDGMNEMNDGISCELIVCALRRYGSCVNPLGIARGQSHLNFMLF